MGAAVTLRIGVIGAGAMGAAHARALHTEVPGAEVTSVFDADQDRASLAAGDSDARVEASAAALIGADDIDAIVVSSPDFTHAELVSACLRAGKPVLCEKPLALTVEESSSLVEAEAEVGRRLVQVGFMRRYDLGFVALFESLRRKELGGVKLMHCVHRNAVSTTSTNSANLITGSMIHELDQVRWLLDDEIETIEVRSPVRDGFADPQLAVLQMRSGVLITVDVFVNAAYGYDVRCEVVGTNGTASVSLPPLLRTRRDGHEMATISTDFLVRFGDAYRRELTDWVAAARQGTARGASAWDGHLANVAAAAGVEALTSGQRVTVPELKTPSLYV
jgi:myo-inositol 2-dehydrogenase / D-chiro-inositol 1-dehydrogenase